MHVRDLAEADLVIRPAVAADTAAIERLQRASLWGIGVRAYERRVIDAVVRHFPTVPHDLIAQGTYHVAERAGTPVACGGWSMASGAPGMPGTLFTPDGAPFDFAPPAGTAVIRAIFVHPRWSRCGLGRRIMRVAELGAAAAGCPSAELVATLSGVPLYRALGYAAGAELNVALCEDVRMPVVHMCKRLCEQAPAVAA